MESLEDARKVAAIGTVTSWFNEQDLKNRGFTNLVSAQAPADNVKKLMNGEVQLCVFTDITVGDIVKSASRFSLRLLTPSATPTVNGVPISLTNPNQHTCLSVHWLRNEHRGRVST